jgi:outer membrane protein assembly factor BamB
VSSPQARHWDTNYSTPIIADVNGTRLLIVGGTDGVFHALQVNTGKPVWSLEVSKRAILNSVLFKDNTVYLSHGEENIDTTEMGMVAAIDATWTADKTA